MVTVKERADRAYAMRESGRFAPEGCIVISANVTDTVGVWVEDGIIAIDGSDTWQEWVGNLLAFRSVRSGAHQSYDRTARCIVNQVLGLIDNEREWHIVGHSRGGAVGVVVYQLLRLLGYRVRCTTFNAPPVGGRRFYGRLIRGGVVEFEVAGDIVCNLPMWWRKRNVDINPMPRQSRNIVDNHKRYREAVAEWMSLSEGC